MNFALLRSSVAIGLCAIASVGFAQEVTGAGATFPAPYFARLRPDFDTSQVWHGGWYYGPMLHVLANEKKLAELPKHYLAALETACGDANQWMQAKYDAQIGRASCRERV